MTHFEAIRPNVMALYFNLSGLLHPEEEIIDAVHDNVGAIRLAVVKVTEKVMILALKRNVSLTNVTITIEAKRQPKTEAETQQHATLDGASGGDGRGFADEGAEPIDDDEDEEYVELDGPVDGLFDGRGGDEDAQGGGGDRIAESHATVRGLFSFEETVGSEVEFVNPRLLNRMKIIREEKKAANPKTVDEDELMSLWDSLEFPKNSSDDDNSDETSSKGGDKGDPQEAEKILKEIELMIEASKSGVDYLEEDELPWVKARKVTKGTTNEIMPKVHGRKPQDNYGESLKYVNKLMNDAFGPAARRVPAHMPHFLNIDLIEQMQAKWPQQFEETSSHFLRSPKDMQFAFAYFYFLMHQRMDFDWDKIWEEDFDRDGDGILSENELRTAATTIHGSAYEPSQYEKERIQWILCTCAKDNCGFANASTSEPTSNDNNSTQDTSETNSTNPIDSNTENSHPSFDTDDVMSPETTAKLAVAESRPLTKIVIQECTVFNKIENFYKKKLKNKFEIVDTAEVAFVMVGTNATDVRRALDGIRARRHKFVCLNDNMNHSNPHAAEVVQVLHDFYESLFPHPSQFELPPDQVNRYLYVDELNEARERIQRKKRSIYLILGVLSLIIIALLRSVWVRNAEYNIRYVRDTEQDTHDD